MKRSEALDKLNGILEDFGKQPASEGDHVLKDLGLDSLDIVEALSEIEERFDMVFDESEFDDELVTVQAVLDYIGEEIGGFEE